MRSANRFVYSLAWHIGSLRDMSTIEIKGSTFTFFVVRILGANVDHFARDLNAWVKKAPDFLSSAPVVLQPTTSCVFSCESLTSIMDILRAVGCVPIGIMTSCVEMIRNAKICGLAIMSKDSPKIKKEVALSVSPSTNSAQIVSHSIRSGQQLYAKNRDLIIVGSVNHGAEVVADGHVHIYGSLRGKALAGASGSEQTSIFTRDFKPQMVAIAGFYQILEEMPAEILEKPVQASLLNSQLSFSAI